MTDGLSMVGVLLLPLVYFFMFQRRLFGGRGTEYGRGPTTSSCLLLSQQKDQTIN